MGVSMGTTAMVARRIGEKRPEAAAQVAVHAVALGVGLGLALGVAAALGAPHLLRAMGATEAVVATGTGYTRILLGGNLVIMLLFIHNAVFRGAGDAGFAMRALWLANGLNLVLDPCLIFGLGPFPELGLTGAAVATTLGRGGGVLLQIWLLRRGRGRLRVRAADWRLQPAVLWRLVRLGASGAGQWLVATASWVILVRMVAGFGGVAVAGYTLAVRIIIFALLPAFGISNAAATLVGQNLGAGRPDRAEKSVWLTGLYASVFLVGVMIAFLLGGDLLVGLFTDDPALIAQAAACLRIVSYGYVFYGWGMVMTQAFNGAGDTTTPLLVNLVFFWMGQIPLAWLLSRQPALAVDGVYWAVALSESALALAAMALFRMGRWKTRQV
jgi:putative MATE family efflux protein